MRIFLGIQSTGTCSLINASFGVLLWLALISISCDPSSSNVVQGKNSLLEIACKLRKAFRQTSVWSESIVAKYLDDNVNCLEPVSYTHLDVYKRQPLN